MESGERIESVYMNPYSLVIEINTLECLKHWNLKNGQEPESNYVHVQKSDLCSKYYLS